MGRPPSAIFHARKIALATTRNRVRDNAQIRLLYPARRKQYKLHLGDYNQLRIGSVEWSTIVRLCLRESMNVERYSRIRVHPESERGYRWK